MKKSLKMYWISFLHEFASENLYFWLFWCRLNLSYIFYNTYCIYVPIEEFKNSVKYLECVELKLSNELWTEKKDTKDLKIFNWVINLKRFKLSE